MSDNRIPKGAKVTGVLVAWAHGDSAGTTLMPIGDFAKMLTYGASSTNDIRVRDASLPTGSPAK